MLFNKLKDKLMGNTGSSTTETASSNNNDDEVSSSKLKLQKSPYCFDHHDQTYNGGTPYQWPTLYEEADEMLQLSLLIYTVTDLRTLAKRHVLLQEKNKKEDSSKKRNSKNDIVLLQNPERILTMPLSLMTSLEMIQDNMDAIQNHVNQDDHAMTMAALTSIQERQARLLRLATTTTGGGGGGKDDVNDNKSLIRHHWFNPMFSQSNSVATSSVIGGTEGEEGIEIQKDVSPVITQYGDDKPDSDLVYAVGTDPIRKRITVVFRGSVTPNDFFTDASIALKAIPNPVKSIADHDQLEYEKDNTKASSTSSPPPPQPDEIGIHEGFFNYLLKERKELPGGISKFQEILNHVQQLYQNDPIARQENYKLYVTGHSLGGALATLFAFYAASGAAAAATTTTASSSDGTIPLPVTVVSVASPRCGEGFFQNAFRYLEKRGMVRHLRVVNDRDPVTIMPKSSSKKIWAMLSPISYMAYKLSDSKFEERETYRHTGIKLKLKIMPTTTSSQEKSTELKDDDDALVTYELVYSGTAETKAERLDMSQCVTMVHHHPAASTTTTTTTDDESQVTTTNKTTVSEQIAKEDSLRNIPDVVFHMGNMYVDNLTSVRPELTDKGLTLNGLYEKIASLSLTTTSST